MHTLGMCTSSGILAEWLRRLIRNQLGIARGSSNLSDVGGRSFTFVIFGSTSTLYRDNSTLAASTRGAMDSASDFESGGCGFESRRVCFLVYFAGGPIQKSNINNFNIHVYKYICASTLCVYRSILNGRLVWGRYLGAE